MTCCKSGEEGKWLNCMRPKVTSPLEGHCHSKSTERVSLMGAGREPCGVSEGLSALLSVKEKAVPRDRDLSCVG